MKIVTQSSEIIPHNNLEPIKYITPKIYLLTQFRVIPTYIRLLILPVGQTIDHDIPLSISLFEMKTFLSFSLLVSIVLYAISAFKKNRFISLGIIWFFLALSIESSFKPLGNLLVEHRLYLPMLGFSMFFVGTFYNVLWKKYPRTATLLFMALIITYSFLTIKRNTVWKNPITLWEDTVKRSPNKERPHYNLAFAYSKAGKFEEGKKNLNIALTNAQEKLPIFMNLLNIVAREGSTLYAQKFYSEPIGDATSDPIIKSNLASTYLTQGNHEEAKKIYIKTLEAYPNSAEAHTGLGNVFLEEGNTREARKYFKKALEINPNLPETLMKIGDSYLMTENFFQAIESYKKAISIRPNYKEVYNNLGIAYLRMHDYDEAKNHFYQAIQINNGYGMAHYNLASTLKINTEYEEAIKEYNKAFTLLPDNYEIYNDLGILYSVLGQLDNAIVQFKKAVNIINNIKSQLYLGISHVRQGKNEIAVHYFNEVLKLNPNHIDAHDFLADAYKTLGKFPEAEKHKKRAEEIRNISQ